MNDLTVNGDTNQTGLSVIQPDNEIDLSAIFENSNRQPEILKALVIRLAHDALGVKPSDTDDALMYEGSAEFMAAVLLGRVEDGASQAFRQHVWEVFQSGSWLNARIPLRNSTGGTAYDANGEAMTQRFETYQDWLDQVADEAGLSNSYLSNIRTLVNVILPHVEAGLLPGITIDQVVALDRSKLDIIASASNKSLCDAPTMKTEALVGLIISASDPNIGKRELSRMSVMAGGRRASAIRFEVHVIQTLDGRNAYLVMPKDDGEEEYLLKMLESRAEFVPTETEELNQLMSGA